MKNEKSLHLLFDKGISENIKQDIKNDSGEPVHDSVLYIENYNPNYEVGSLIKRPSDFPITDLSNNPLFFRINDYVNRVLYHAYNNSGYEYLDTLMIQAMVLKTANPKYNDTYVVFARRIASDGGEPENDYVPVMPNGKLPLEATAVISRNYDGTDFANSEPAWKEPFVDHASYPGWYTFGTMMDVTRYGESLIFVTNIKGFTPEVELRTIAEQFARAANYLFPCYVWKLWDLTKVKQTELFNGYNIDLADTSIWKVKAPSLSLTKQALSIIALSETASGFDLGNTGWGTVGSMLRNSEQTVVEDISTFDSPSNIEVLNYDDPHEVDDNDEVILRPIQLLIWEQPMYGYDELPTDAGAGTDADDLSPAAYITPINPYFDNEKEWAHVGNSASYKHLESIHVPEFEVNKDPTEMISEFSGNNLGYDIRFLNAGRWTEEGQHTTGGIVRARYVDLAYRFVYNNYPENKMPRPWNYKEKLPLLVTMTIDGIEVLLGKCIYEIKSRDAKAGHLTAQRELCDYHANYRDKYSLTPASGDVDHVAPAEKLKSVLQATRFTYEVEEIAPLAAGTGTAVNVNPGILYDEDTSPQDYYPANCDGTCDILFTEVNVYFTVRIDKDYINQIIENNVTSINVYIAKPDLNDSMVNELGTLTRIDPPQGMYHPPLIRSNDQLKQYENYGLVKKFIIQGKGSPVQNALIDNMDIQDWESYDGYPVNTNAWKEDGDYLVAVPQNANYTPPTDLPSLFTATYTLDVDQTILQPNELTPKFKDQCFTPDFMIWDYAIDSEPLLLQASGVYWEGKGAELICAIKGRIFLGNCIDKYGNYEPGLIRYSAVQSGVISFDIFNDEDKMKVGHELYTALIEFREELVIFDRNHHFRLQLNEITNPLTWEFVEAISGSGTFGRKTVCVAPQGFVFGNEAGIWISDGSVPMSLTNNMDRGLFITGLYQSLLIGNPYVYQHIIEVGNPLIENGYNHYAEFLYDGANDEIVIITPVMTTGIPDSWDDFDKEIRLIYNFQRNNWRVESRVYGVPEHASVALTGKTLGYSRYGRASFPNPAIITLRSSYYDDVIGTQALDYEESICQYYGPDYDMLQDVTWGPAVSPVFADIEGIVITHEVGDGINDYLLKKAILEVQPMNTKSVVIGNSVELMLGYENFVYGIGNYDPVFEFELRNRGWADDPFTAYSESYYNVDGVPVVGSSSEGWYDLIYRNMATRIGTIPGTTNPFINSMQTMGGTNNPTNFYPRESMVILAPINTKFRRSRFRLKSSLIARIRSITIDVVKFMRRSI